MESWKPTMTRDSLRDLGKLPPAVSTSLVRTVEQMLDNPWADGLHCEKVPQAERAVYSCRVDESYCLIWKHIEPYDMVLCLVDRQVEAYRRAARTSFRLQDGMVKVVDLLHVSAKPVEGKRGLVGRLRGVQGEPRTLFADYSDEQLLDIGVPEYVLPNVRLLDNPKQLTWVKRLLSGEAYGQLLEIALSVVEKPTVPDKQLQQRLEHHQGGYHLHRFINGDEFQRALAGNMEEWMLFLTPRQRALATRSYSGPARVKGVVGSGKTVVAIHRARNLARQALKTGGKVLFLTYDDRLAGVAWHQLQGLAGEGAPELEAVDCSGVAQWCYRFLVSQGKNPVVDKEAVQQAVQHAIFQIVPHYPGLSLWARPWSFFYSEISYAIKGRDVRTIDEYLALDRSGRGTPLRDAHRRAVYAVYKAYQTDLKRRGLWDYGDFVLETLRLFRPELLPVPYVAAVVDEIQDLTQAAMHLIRRIVPPGPNDLFLVGDGLQRIYPGGYALKSLGIDIIGRGALLSQSFRNTREILRAAHAMVAGVRLDNMDDADGEAPEPEFSERRGDVPRLHGFATPYAEVCWVMSEIARLKKERGYADSDFALIYRWQRPYADLIKLYLSPHVELSDLQKATSSYWGSAVKYGTFDSAKGLTFTVVFVLGVTDGLYVPRDNPTLQNEELEDYLDRERRRLYVAMTRARDLLYLSYSQGQPSCFLANVPDELLRRGRAKGA